MRNRKRVTVANIGMSSMFVILFGLCFAVLAALAIATAQHDYELSRRLAEHTTDYYAAYNQAQELLLDTEALYQQTDEDGYASFSVPVQEGQELSVEICFDETGSEYVITKWQVVNTGEWNGDASLPVLKQP